MKLVFTLLGVSIILAGIALGGSVAHFIDMPSIFIVFGITVFFTMAHHSAGSTAKAFAAALKDETRSVSDCRQYIRVLSTARMLASASGLVGMLIGLVNMLAHMDDPTAIGPAMAVALLTALYGVMLAELLIGPLINRLLMQVPDSDSNDKPMKATAVTVAAPPVAMIAFLIMIISIH